jgi:hypothetical protein
MNRDRYTIRNLDENLMMEARLLAIQNRWTLGETINDALSYYFCDEDDVADTDDVAA